MVEDLEHGRCRQQRHNTVILRGVTTDDHSVPPADGTRSTVLEPVLLEPLINIQKQDPDKAAELVELFLQEAETRLDLLRQDHGDAEAVARVAHSLKGSCRMFAATGMVDLCDVWRTPTPRETVTSWRPRWGGWRRGTSASPSPSDAHSGSQTVRETPQRGP